MSLGHLTMKVVTQFNEEQREFSTQSQLVIWGDLVDQVLKFLNITQFDISSLDVNGVQIGFYPNRLIDNISLDLNAVAAAVVSINARGRDEYGRVLPSEFPGLYDNYQIELEDTRILRASQSASGYSDRPSFTYIPVIPVERGQAGLNTMNQALRDILQAFINRSNYAYAGDDAGAGDAGGDAGAGDAGGDAGAGDAGGDAGDAGYDAGDAEDADEYDDIDEEGVVGEMQHMFAQPAMFVDILQLGGRGIFSINGVNYEMGGNNIFDALRMVGAGAPIPAPMEDVKIVCKPEDVEKCLHCCYEELPQETRNKSSTCNICLTDFTSDSKVMRLTECSHIFHPDCIKHWLTTSSNKCPVCRVPVGTGTPL